MFWYYFWGYFFFEVKTENTIWFSWIYSKNIDIFGIFVAALIFRTYRSKKCSLAKSLTVAIECMLFVRMVGVIGIWLSERMLSILLKCFQSRWFYLEMSIKSKCQQYAQGCETKYRANQEHCSFFGKTKILSKFKIPFEMNWIANDIIIIPFWYNCQNSRFDGAENRKYFSQELKIDQFKVMVGSVWFGLFSIRSVWFRW